MSGAAVTELPESMSQDISLFQQALAERLHDGPLQELVALQLSAANLVRARAADASDQTARIAELGSLAQAAIDNLQQIIRDLLGDASQPIPLVKRLDELCDQFRSGSGIECRVMVVPAHVEFEPSVAEIVFRTLRELLTNVRKHSKATAVKLTSRLRQDDAVAITVADNGVGLQSVTQRKHPFEGGGFGLWSIEHRLGELGGMLEIASDAGLHATVVVPRKFLLKG
ncbi:MAG TPA: ATP-binding protein [Gammaproteobacteria bacterium]|nr:ATP-binding protein [Gammaproteobacteria bacterium]